MRILFYFGVFAKVGGIEEFTKDLALALVEEGEDVEILCASLRNPILDHLKNAGVKVSRIPVFHGCRWGIPDYALLPFAKHKMKQADVVIHQKPFFQKWYRRFSRRPKHVYITAYRPTEQFSDPAGIKTFFSFFDIVLTQVDVFQDDLSESGVPVEVVPYIPIAPVPVENAGVKSGVLRIGMMGRLEPQKNPMYALDIVEKLNSNLPMGFDSVEFNIYGSGSLEAQVRDRVGRMDVKVFLHGKYERASVPDIVRANNMFLITSISEGQCIVALEVLAMGRPVFATPIGALPTILKKPERGALLPQNDADSGATGICSWLNMHPALSAQQIQNSYLEDYDPDRVKRRYVEILENLASAKE